MLGLGSFGIFFVFMLTILSALFCFAYGIIYWNKDGEVSDEEIDEEKKWGKEEKEIEENL